MIVDALLDVAAVALTMIVLPLGLQALFSALMGE